MSGRVIWALDQGRFLTSDITAGLKFYDGADTLISSRTRRDETLRARVTLGLPINSLLPETAGHDWFENFLILLSGEYYTARSNIENYTYDNARAQVLLNKSWRF